MCAWLLLMCAGRFGLCFNPWCNLFLARHMFMHISCIRILSFLSILFYLWCVSSLSLSLSLSQIDCAWHPSTNLLQLGTFFVLDRHLLLLIFPLFMFGSMMRRPIRVSLRTFLIVAFIQKTMWFCRILLTLLYPMSFTLGDGNLFMRYPWGVPSCSYKSFTPICMVSIPLYLSLLQYSEVHVS